MMKSRVGKAYPCRFSSMTLPAWLSVLQERDGAMRLGHLSQHHPTGLAPFLERMHTTKDIAPVVARAFEGSRGETSEFIMHDV
jgi:hypothetical protein